MNKNLAPIMVNTDFEQIMKICVYRKGGFAMGRYYHSISKYYVDLNAKGFCKLGDRVGHFYNAKGVIVNIIYSDFVAAAEVYKQQTDKFDGCTQHIGINNEGLLQFYDGTIINNFIY